MLYSRVLRRHYHFLHRNLSGFHQVCSVINFSCLCVCVSIVCPCVYCLVIIYCVCFLCLLYLCLCVLCVLCYVSVFVRRHHTHPSSSARMACLIKMQTEISSGIPLTIKTERISTLKLHSNFCKLFIAQFSLIHTIEYEHIIIYQKNSVITLTRNCSYTILF